MDIIQDWLASLWLLSPMGAALWVALTALLLMGVPARIIEAVGSIRWRRRPARRPLAPDDAAVASRGEQPARMSR